MEQQCSGGSLTGTLTLALRPGGTTEKTAQEEHFLISILSVMPHFHVTKMIALLSLAFFGTMLNLDFIQCYLFSYKW